MRLTCMLLLASALVGASFVVRPAQSPAKEPAKELSAVEHRRSILIAKLRDPNIPEAAKAEAERELRSLNTVADLEDRVKKLGTLEGKVATLEKQIHDFRAEIDKPLIATVTKSNFVAILAEQSLLWQTIPDMQLSFDVADAKPLQILFNAGAHEAVLGGARAAGTMAGVSQFRLVADDGAVLSQTSHFFCGGKDGINFGERDVALQWAGSLPVGKRTVRVEWRSDPTVHPGLQASALYICHGDAANRTLTVRLR